MRTTLTASEKLRVEEKASERGLKVVDHAAAKEYFDNAALYAAGYFFFALVIIVLAAKIASLG